MQTSQIISDNQDGSKMSLNFSKILDEVTYIPDANAQNQKDSII